MGYNVVALIGVVIIFLIVFYTFFFVKYFTEDVTDKIILRKKINVKDFLCKVFMFLQCLVLIIFISTVAIILLMVSKCKEFMFLR